MGLIERFRQARDWLFQDDSTHWGDFENKLNDAILYGEARDEHVAALRHGIRTCLDAERERRQQLKPGAPAHTYTVERIRLLEQIMGATDGDWSGVYRDLLWLVHRLSVLETNAEIAERINARTGRKDAQALLDEMREGSVARTRLIMDARGLLEAFRQKGKG